MKLATGLLFGAVVGAAAGVAALYYNPLTEPEEQMPADGDWALSYRFPEGDAIAFTHGAHGRLAAYPPGVEELWESTISGAAVSVLTLRQADGTPAAIASRLSAASADTDLLLEGALWADHWLVSVPGEGSLFIRAESNVWPFVKDSLVPVWYLHRPWQGPTEYRPTAGPGVGDTAVVIGASGRFAGATGSAVERYRLERFGAHGPEALTGELYLKLDEPVAVAAE